MRAFMHPALIVAVVLSCAAAARSTQQLRPPVVPCTLSHLSASKRSTGGVDFERYTRGRRLLSDKRSTDQEPHPEPPYEEQYWFNYYEAPLDQAPIVPEGRITVTDKFDSGFRIHAVEVLEDQEPVLINLNISNDPYSPFDMTYFGGRFYFRVSGAKGIALKLRYLNADWPDDYAPNYSVRATYDRSLWFQVNTTYTLMPGMDGADQNGVLEFSLIPEYNVVYFATWGVKTLEDTANDISRWQQDERVTVSTIGQSLDHRDIQLVQIGQPGGEKWHVWVTTGQHPSEKQGLFFVQGMVDRLLDSQDPVSMALLSKTVFYVVPNMNPDGNYLGHHRTNRDGWNLNRAWGFALNSGTPEVLAVELAMNATGVDFYMDIHANEHYDLNNFFYPSPPNWDATVNITRFAFERALKATNPEYTGEETGYLTPDPTNQGPTNYADEWTSSTFHCVAGTLELTAKDLRWPLPQNETTGWSPQRSAAFGAQTLEAVLMTVPYIRVNFSTAPPPSAYATDLFGPLAQPPIATAG